MIEIRSNGSPSKLELIVNGVPAQEGDEFSFIRLPNSTSIDVKDHRLSDKLLDHRFSDLPPSMYSVEIPCPPCLIEDPDILKSLTIRRRLRKPECYVVKFEISFEFEDWKKIWSASDYGRVFKAHFDENALPDLTLEFEDDEFVSSGFNISSEILNENLIIGKEVSLVLDVAERCHENALRTLALQLQPESVTTLFDFPEQVRVPCEQYLLFFVQFLKDLGVEATAELREQSGYVLFAVTPKSKEEALDKIRTALETYLSLPMSNLSGVEGDVTVQQLASNVYHLKSQLALAHAVVQAKNATIDAQHFTIIQQQRLLSGEVIIDSLKRVSPRPKDDDSERVLGGIAEITKYEGKGFNVNLPEIYRRLRRLFNDE